MIDMDFLKQVAQVVKEAGQIVQDIANAGFNTEFKSGDDPVTTADLAANEYLQTHLLRHLPIAGWLSEETQDNPDRLTEEYVWIVDPIDGTREFVERVPQYAVSVGLARHGVPILGVICNPALDECFSGIVGMGAWLNGEPMRSYHAPAEKLSVLGSRSEMKRGELARFMEVMDVSVVGSVAYKLALIAAGRAHATFSLVPKNEWDIAAGVALVQAAGGRVTHLTGEPFMFNQRDTLVRGIVAATDGEFDGLMAQLEVK